MSALRKKLVSDLWRLRYQALTIALLVGCGVASFVAAEDPGTVSRAAQRAGVGRMTPSTRTSRQ